MTLDQALSELQSPEAKTRMQAIRWLRVRGGTQAIEALLSALDDRDDDVHLRALVSLWEMKAREAVPVLSERLRGAERPGWKQAYIQALDQIGDHQAVPSLLAALADPDEETVSAACGALATLEDRRAVEPLMRLLDAPRWQVRKAACNALFELGVTEDRLIAALKGLAEEAPPPPLDWMALAQEAGAESRLYPGLEFLAGLARAPEAQTGQTQEEQLRSECREMLDELARRRAGLVSEEAEALDDEEVPAGELEAALAQIEDPDLEKRRTAVERLGRLDAPEAAAAVVRALDDPSSRVRSSAALTLARWKAPEAVPVLIRRLLGDDSSYVRRFCARRLEGYPGEEVTDALCQALNDENEFVVGYATSALWNRGDRRATPSLLARLDHPDRNMRLDAAEVLVGLQAADQRLVDTLEELAHDPEVEVFDLKVAESNCWVERARELYAADGLPVPKLRLNRAELVEQARRLLREAEGTMGSGN